MCHNQHLFNNQQVKSLELIRDKLFQSSNFPSSQTIFQHNGNICESIKINCNLCSMFVQDVCTIITSVHLYMLHVEVKKYDK